MDIRRRKNNVEFLEFRDLDRNTFHFLFLFYVLRIPVSWTINKKTTFCLSSVTDILYFEIKLSFFKAKSKIATKLLLEDVLHISQSSSIELIIAVFREKRQKFWKCFAKSWF